MCLLVVLILIICFSETYVFHRTFYFVHDVLSLIMRREIS